MMMRFEDVVGPGGGGDVHLQHDTVAKLYRHLGIDCSENELAGICSSIFSSASPTFHQGQVAQWPAVFDEDIKSRFKELTGEAIIRYGYESSNHW